MKKIIVLLMMMIVSLSWAVSKSQAQCPDTSYFIVKIQVRNSSCATLCDSAFIVYPYFSANGSHSHAATPQIFMNSQTTYQFCVPGPANSDICAYMTKIASCKDPSNLYVTNFPVCAGLWNFPTYSSKYTPQPIQLIIDYCLR
jgi:hypothetical protein